MTETTTMVLPTTTTLLTTFFTTTSPTGQCDQQEIPTTRMAVGGLSLAVMTVIAVPVACLLGCMLNVPSIDSTMCLTPVEKINK